MSKPLPKALHSMIALLTKHATTLGFTAYPDVPATRPVKFARVEPIGGTEHSTGLFMSPAFAFQCYATSTGECETMCANLIAYLKDSQFTWYGPVQYRGFEIHSLPVPFDDPKVSDRRRWQFTATFGMSNYTKS